ncbi:MAG: hypothetical protein NVV62_10915 [Terricaulis sp.]|nr:hypothetical protein [Terricaulis sp.]
MTALAHRASGIRGGFALALAMLAIVFQTLVLAPHVHAAAPAEEAGYHLPHTDEAPDALAACALCRHAASARALITPPELALPAPPAPLPHAHALFADTSITRAPSLAWRSRAPPPLLR